MLWKRWSRRLSRKHRYFIALRHYSFSWHIMFLIKIACELIKMFIQAPFFFFFPILLTWPCFFFTFMLKLSSILILLLLLATNLADSLYINLAFKKTNLKKKLILNDRRKRMMLVFLMLKPKLMKLAWRKSVYLKIIVKVIWFLSWTCLLTQIPLFWEALLLKATWLCNIIFLWLNWLIKLLAKTYLVPVESGWVQPCDNNSWNAGIETQRTWLLGRLVLDCEWSRLGERLKYFICQQRQLSKKKEVSYVSIPNWT